jgi:putative membrane protein
MRTLFGVLAAVAAGVALAQGANPDQAFFDKLAQGGMAEVQAGQVAQSKATRPELKEFAAMMVKDHGKANEKLKTLAAKKSVKLPADAGAEHKATLKKLEGSSGEAFDKAYIQSQLDGHETTVELLKYEIDSGADADAKAFASEVLPTVKAHLDKIQKIAKDAGVRK